MHSFHYQETEADTPWCIEVDGVITHDWKFDGEVSIIHERIDGDYWTLTFECDDLRYVRECIEDAMWTFQSTFYSFDFDRRDLRGVRKWLDNLSIK